MIAAYPGSVGLYVSAGVSVAVAGLSVAAALRNLAPVALLDWATAASVALLRSRRASEPLPIG